MKVGILGSGAVARTLGAGFLTHEYEVMLGTRSPDKLAGWKKENPGASVGSFADTAAFGEVLVLAVKGTVAVDALATVPSKALAGKTILDATNPIADQPPLNGVLHFFTASNESLLERLQDRYPEAHFVKAFNSVGSPRMVNPEYKAGRPTMFICGKNPPSKKAAAKILDTFGWDTEDMGGVEAARAIEPLCMLWCIPGFLHNEWTHAFKLLR